MILVFVQFAGTSLLEKSTAHQGIGAERESQYTYKLLLLEADDKNARI